MYRTGIRKIIRIIGILAITAMCMALPACKRNETTVRQEKVQLKFFNRKREIYAIMDQIISDFNRSQNSFNCTTRILHFENRHDRVIGEVEQRIFQGFIRHLLRIEFAGKGLEAIELITKANAGHCHALLNEGLMEAITVIVILLLVEVVQSQANLLMAFNLVVTDHEIYSFLQAGGNILRCSPSR